jgi:hypothetical protein
MSLVTGSGAVAKIKNIKVTLTGFTGTSGMTSVFGAGSDINCPDVEYVSIGRPDTDENEETEFVTNKRTVKESVASNGWQTFSKMAVFNDDGGTNWRAFVAARETDATGTMTFARADNGETIGSWKCKVSSVEGGDGDASAVDSSFTPTFTLLEALSAGV